MRDLWMGIIPGLEFTRVVVQDGWAPPLLKARLPESPQSPRALEALCEAIALWCGRKVCAALVVDGPDFTCVTKQWLDTAERVVERAPFVVHLVSRGRPAEERDLLDGMHDYHDLRHLVFSEEVAS